MGVYSEILISIEELHANKRSSADIAQAINKEYKTNLDAETVDEIISEWQDDWAQNGSM